MEVVHRRGVVLLREDILLLTHVPQLIAPATPQQCTYPHLTGVNGTLAAMKAVVEAMAAVVVEEAMGAVTTELQDHQEFREKERFEEMLRSTVRKHSVFFKRSSKR
jgi:hypothetical protein